MARVHYWELSNYNNGRLVGKWFDLDGMSKEEHMEELRAWLEELPSVDGYKCEEWILGDVEDVPSHMHGEYGINDEFFEMQEFLSNTHLDEDMVKAGLELEIPLDKLEDAYIGQFEDDEAYAMDCVANGCLGEVSETIEFYIDWEKLAHTLMFDANSSDGYYFSANW